jgi:hypothetical protein
MPILAAKRGLSSGLAQEQAVLVLEMEDFGTGWTQKR